MFHIARARRSGRNSFCVRVHLIYIEVIRNDAIRVCRRRAEWRRRLGPLAAGERAQQKVNLVVITLLHLTYVFALSRTLGNTLACGEILVQSTFLLFAVIPGSRSLSSLTHFQLPATVRYPLQNEAHFEDHRLN